MMECASTLDDTLRTDLRTALWGSFVSSQLCQPSSGPIVRVQCVQKAIFVLIWGQKRASFRPTAQCYSEARINPSSS